MAAPKNAQTETPGEFGRRDLLETRVSRLEESVNRAVGTLMPKVEALLSERSEEVSSSSSAPTPAAPAPSLLELAERGDGETLLHMLAEELVDIRNSPPRTRSGDTPLHMAAGGGHLKAVMALLGAGAPVDVAGGRLRTPLHCAAARGHLRVARHLLCAGAKVDVEDADGATALKLATGNGYSLIVGSLLENGASCNDAAGRNVLEMATGKGYTEIVRLLLERGAQGDGKLASLALSNGSKALVQLFLEKGVSVDACNEGEPLLVHAAKVERWDIVDLLLERGASPTKCKNDRECALAYASKGDQADAVRHLLRRGAASKARQVKLALSEAPSAAVVWAVVDVVPEQVRGEAGRGALFHAAQNGLLEKVVALLEVGVDVNSKDVFGATALHLTSMNGHIECVRELLGHGADVNLKDGFGNTQLHAAAQNGHVECVRALLGAGASAAEKKNSGQTPLDLVETDEVRRAFNGQ